MNAKNNEATTTQVDTQEASDKHTAKQDSGKQNLRLLQPDRTIIIPAMPLDQLIGQNHLARKVWAFVLTRDLSLLYADVGSRLHVAGRTAKDPSVLLALWLYALLVGVTSARELQGMCAEDLPCRWILGGLSINHHSLSTFLVKNQAFLDDLLNSIVDELVKDEKISLDRIAIDGVRVRASAGADTFRREKTINEELAEAKQEQKKLKERLSQLPVEERPSQLVANPSSKEQPEEDQAAVSVEQESPQEQECQEVTAREKSQATKPAAKQEMEKQEEKKPTLRENAAQLRSAEELIERVGEAQERLKELQEKKEKPADKEKVRVSTTDPDATVMKMADGGFRPAYNLGFATTCVGKVITEVFIDQRGSDRGLLGKVVDEIEEEKKPKEVLVDGGYVVKEDIEKLEKKEIKVYAPVPGAKKEPEKMLPEKGDSESIKGWKTRMSSEEGKEIYKLRGETAEFANADMRNHGMQRLLVRGLKKVTMMAYWFAITFNLRRYLSLQG
jgi:transposase